MAPGSRQKHAPQPKMSQQSAVYFSACLAYSTVVRKRAKSSIQNVQAYSHLGMNSDCILAEAVHPGNLYKFCKAEILFSRYNEVMICADGGSIILDVGWGRHERSRRLLSVCRLGSYLDRSGR